MNCHGEDFSIFGGEDSGEPAENSLENCVNGVQKKDTMNANFEKSLTNGIAALKRDTKSIVPTTTTISLVHYVPSPMDNNSASGSCSDEITSECLDEENAHYKNSIHTVYFNERGQCSSRKERFCCSNCENKQELLNGHGENNISDNEAMAAASFEPNLPASSTLSPELDFLEFDIEEQNLSDEEIKSDNSSGNSRAHTPLLLEAASIPSGNSSVGNVKNDLGGNSSFVRNCFVHSLSYQNVVSSPKYHNNCLRPSAHSNFELRNLDDLLCNENSDSDFANLEACGQRLLRRENSLFSIPTEDMDFEEYNMQSAILCSYSAPKYEKRANCAEELTTLQSVEASKSVTTISNDDEIPLEKIMIWSEMEACTRQVTQIGTSACGATAVINVLMALNVTYDKSNIDNCIHTRFRAETSPVAEYLISRSTAGTTHDDLIDGIFKLTSGSVVGRFFHMYPARDFHLLQWLGFWIAKGAVPIATLNLQRGIAQGQSIPDAWHHQMVFGVGPKGVYLTNPLECVTATQIEQQLNSDSVLLVRRNDILCRWDKECDLSPLITQGQQWRERNVIGQVVNMLREATSSWVPGQRRHLTSHVKIPAAYKSGITLFVNKETATSVWEELMSCPELPVASCRAEAKS